MWTAGPATARSWQQCCAARIATANGGATRKAPRYPRIARSIVLPSAAGLSAT